MFFARSAKPILAIAVSALVIQAEKAVRDDRGNISLVGLCRTRGNITKGKAYGAPSSTFLLYSFRPVDSRNPQNAGFKSAAISGGLFAQSFMSFPPLIERPCVIRTQDASRHASGSRASGTILWL